MSKTLEFTNPIQFTLDTHDVYEQNDGLLAKAVDYSVEDYKNTARYLGWVMSSGTYDNDNIGAFGPIDSEEPRSDDPIVRGAAMFGHLGFPATHAFYTMEPTNCDGEILMGGKPYVVTMPYKADVKEFWSLTRYSGLTRNTLPNAQDVYNAYNTKPDVNGDITVTFSVEDPKDGSYWMPVNAGEPYYYVERFYLPNDYNNFSTIKKRCAK